MSIFDLLDDEPVHYAFSVLEFGIFDAKGGKHYRCTAWGGCQIPSIKKAQTAIREKFPDLEFVDPPRKLVLGDNLGHLTYKHRWNIACIHRVDTGSVVSVGWITPPTSGT